MNAQLNSGTTILGLDVGERRIGVALARADVRIAQPLVTIDADQAVQQIIELVQAHDAGVVVVGLPRGLDGQETAQTRYVEVFVDGLRESLPADMQIELQDEALTSRKAEAELTSRGKPYEKADIDKLAATFILEDYLSSLSVPTGPHHV